MPQRGTEDALYDLMTYIYKELNLKKIVLMVSLDIEGAFDNAWWPALKAQLLAYNCPVNLYGMVKGYLRDREVIVRYAGGVQKGTSKGCIQGSIAGPTFWNLILDSLPENSGTRRIRSGVCG
ncbi:Putative 115 kDa protein in type-1 retrotransposable element R1DM [Eumeta japonica]|uniref:115 kDa protein in type-1 retrotransposable element R1DM n=1 Tax=Eumeta variegata TaxID=151549 RepID=A0A4C1ZTM7_EUMVA|nr:Putative 115 kDa protein in type-1 retrotransposable element R1DM [Eumeta japonica]